MNKLSTEQMLYLLYALAYSEDGSVTQGTVNGHLPTKIKDKADKICTYLCNQGLLNSPKRRRIHLTEPGKRELIISLKNTEYKFESSKGKKVLNTLLYCLQEMSYQDEIKSDMNFEAFSSKLKELYLKRRKQQELEGVVAIKTQDIYEEFMGENPISSSLWNQYFSILKSSGQIFTVTEKNEEIIQWGSK